ncbi:MAG: ArsR family transcriptional regulator [Desulfurococcaceae archaeon]
MDDFSLSAEELERLSRKVRLKVLHEDDDIVIAMAPTEDELVSMVYEMLLEKPMNLKEIHAVLSGIASEDKIRRALNALSEEGSVVIEGDGRYRAVPLRR